MKFYPDTGCGFFFVHFFFNVFHLVPGHSGTTRKVKTERTICLVVPALHDHTFCVWRQHKHGYLLISYLEGESWGAPDLKFYRDLSYDLKQRQRRWDLLDCDMKENKFAVCKIRALLFMCRYLWSAYYFPNIILHAGWTAVKDANKILALLLVRRDIQ